MYSAVKCFVMDPVPFVRVSLRRYSPNSTCLGGRIHSAVVVIEPKQPEETTLGYDPTDKSILVSDSWNHGDPRWPKKCDRCDYQFVDHDEWQYFPKHLYARRDQPEIVQTIEEFAPGALWRLPWMEDSEAYRGVDGQSWMCRCPSGHDWMIDARANNCTMPDDTKHKCWCRHGEAPEFHVDKVGLTCAAGAGSIVAGDYHGFLHNGWLTAG